MKTNSRLQKTWNAKELVDSVANFIALKFTERLYSDKGELFGK